MDQLQHFWDQDEPQHYSISTAAILAKVLKEPRPPKSSREGSEIIGRCEISFAAGIICKSVEC